MQEIRSYGSVGVPAGNRRHYPEALCSARPCSVLLHANANGVLPQSPRLARQRLPWVDIQNREQPQRGCDRLASTSTTPLGLMMSVGRFPR